MKKIIGKNRRPRVALLIETSRTYSREMLIGIAKYIHVHGSWSVECEEGDPGGHFPEWFDRWNWDGIIAQVKTPAMGRRLRRCKVPVVDVYGALSNLGFPSLRANDQVAGRMGAEHLLERGFRRFAFCGFNGIDWSDNRLMGFLQRIAEAGFSCQVFENPHRPRSGESGWEEHGKSYDEELKQWLGSLPQPVGLMVCNDSRGLQVLGCCRELSLKVPDEVAVVGVDKDEIFSELSDVPLTSVILNPQKTGYEAAALLERLMAGEIPSTRSILIEPIGVAVRRSTEVLAIEDRQIAAAVAFIREHACDGLDVPALLREVHMSRSVFERRFKKVLGRSPNQEILRAQLDRVCELLEASDLSLLAVAEKAGFKHIQHLSRLFRKKKGKTLGEFRKQFGTNPLKQ